MPARESNGEDSAKWGTLSVQRGFRRPAAVFVTRGRSWSLATACVTPQLDLRDAHAPRVLVGQALLPGDTCL